MKKPQEFQSVKEWADSHRPMLPPLIVRHRAAGPGWLDDDTPCACERVTLMHGGRALSISMIEWLISRPLGSDGIRTFDPRGKGTKGQ